MWDKALDEVSSDTNMMEDKACMSKDFVASSLPSCVTGTNTKQQQNQEWEHMNEAKKALNRKRGRVLIICTFALLLSSLKC